MQYQEFGSQEKETTLLLHGGGLSWWNYREAAALLENDYHVVLPILDGHAGSDRPFTTIEENASEIISFIDEDFGGHVLLIGGLSLGAQVLLEMLSERKDICSYALVESAAVIPSKLTNALIGPAFGSGYGLIRNKAFSKLQFRSLHIKEELFEEYYRDTCLIKKADMIAFMKANTSYELKETLGETEAEVHVYFGEKETGEIRRSSEVIKKALPFAVLHPLPGYRHGDFSINHAGAYAEEVRRILSARPHGRPQSDKAAGGNMKPIFESDNIIFTALSELLADDYLTMVNDYENVNRFIGGKHKSFTREQELAWVQIKREEKALVFSMLEKKSRSYIWNIEMMTVKDCE